MSPVRTKHISVDISAKIIPTILFRLLMATVMRLEQVGKLILEHYTDQSMTLLLQATPRLIFMFSFAKILNSLVCTLNRYTYLCSAIFSIQTSSGAIGIAWVGSMCKTNWYGGNAGINEKRENVLATSEVRIYQL